MKRIILALMLIFTTNAFASALSFQRITKTYGATGSSTVFLNKYLSSMYYSVAANSGAVILLEKSFDGLNWQTAETFSGANGSGIIKNENNGTATTQYRMRCSSYTSGSPVIKLDEIPYYPNGKLGKRVMFSAGGLSKYATSAGFSVDATNSTSLVTLPASKTDAKLVFHVPNIPVGAIIKSFNLVGQAESAGNNVSMDASLAVATSVSTDVSEAVEASITRLALTDDAVLGAANTEKVLSAPRVVNEDENVFILLTATTAASTDIALQGFVIEYDEP